jgi:ribonuclease HII
MALARLIVCGVDEAGRGPLAGPVYAAAVILDPRRPIRGLDDSKKLAEATRLALAERIRARALAWAVASATVAEIDALNVLRASLLAMKRAIESLPVRPERVLVDGLHCPAVAISAEAVVGGDAAVKAISAASILAKTERDAEMVRLHARFPHYGFDRHKGYPTADHLDALRIAGPRAGRPVRRGSRLLASRIQRLAHDGKQAATLGCRRKQAAPCRNACLEAGVKARVGTGAGKEASEGAIVLQRVVAGVAAAEHAHVPGHARRDHRHARACRLADHVGAAFHA